VDAKLELAQLLARFKLMVRRSLNQTVDLDRLAREPDYARIRLTEIEDAAMDEELLVMVVRLRDWLVPPLRRDVQDAESGKPSESEKLRDYRLGARAW
jgi:hypothetical protein